MTPEKKCRKSAARLGCYSIILIFLSVVASELKIFAFIAAVFAPLAHELLILYGAKEEEEGIPFFEHKDAGVKVIFARKDSIASKLKLEPGDTIIGVNGNRIYNESQLEELLSTYPAYIWMDVKKASGKVVTVDHTDYRAGIGSLGALIVPREPQLYYEISKGSSLIKRLMDRFNRKNDKKDLDA
jgi:membrane-associated protease RseP (regulator of RpoE activity)